jgi:DNA-binding HxlR family transcriptional regulator
MKQRTDSACPLCFCLDIFGDKWTLLIVRDSLLFGKRYYRDFLNAGEGIATNILANRLKRLVEHGLLTREDDPENTGQVIYLPTERMLALRHVLDAMMDWGHKYRADTSQTDASCPGPKAIKRRVSATRGRRSERRSTRR